jgi:2-polyprenyl-3-methyl-5-hydroxy-6-metoxy-1,4-benzoquinol methylase
MACGIADKQNWQHCFSHTHHFVSVQQFDTFVEGLLHSEKFDETKKKTLEALVRSNIWEQIRQSSFWRHALYNGGLSGPFTEYFACFNPLWEGDFWGEKVQPIERIYLSQHAIPRAYQSTVAKTRHILAEHARKLAISGQEKIKIASLACGTMYDVFGADYAEKKKISVLGRDVDSESLQLAKEKASLNGFFEENVHFQECDVVKQQIKKNEYDIIVCNGFSFYLNDHDLSQVINNVRNALKPKGIFIMSFIQPLNCWNMNENEKKVDDIVRPILETFPKKWSSNLRTSDQVMELVKENGFKDVTVVSEAHGIHPLILARDARHSKL